MANYSSDGSMRGACETGDISREALLSNVHNVGAAAGTGVSVKETGFGDFKSSIFTFADVTLALTDVAGTIAYTSLKFYDFPVGYIYVISVCSDLAVTKSSAGVDADWNGDFAIGTAAAAADNGLTSTEVDLLPKTATPKAVSGVTTADGASTATEHAVHDGTTTAKDAYINILVDDADQDVTTTACNLILNGTIRINWVFMGDN